MFIRHTFPRKKYPCSYHNGMIACMNGVNCVRKLELHHQLLSSRKSCSRKFAPLLCMSVFGIHDPIGLSYLTQLRVGPSKSKLQKFKHNFRDTINPMCPSNDGIEGGTEHFLLLCPSFEVQRRNLLAGVFALLRPFGYIDLSNEVLTQLLLFGDKGLPNDVNRKILKLTLPRGKSLIFFRTPPLKSQKNHIQKSQNTEKLLKITRKNH